MPATIQLQEGKYVFQEELSTLGDIRRYTAIDTTSDAAVEIVEFPSDAPELHKRAEALAKFRHPSAIAVVSSFSEDGRLYLVTETSAGKDLASLMDSQRSPFPVDSVVEWADCLLDVLFRLNTCRPPQVHLQVRPSSIFRDQNGKVSLSIPASLGAWDSSFTQTSAENNGDSLPFSALEQLWHGLDAASQKVIMSNLDQSSGKILTQELDERTDIYSLGATIYYLVTGKLPLDALERSIEVIDGKPDPLVSPNSVDPAIPREISDVVMKAVEIRREFRFDSAAIMRQVLRSARLRAKERNGDHADVEAEIVATMIAEPVSNEHASPSNNWAQNNALSFDALSNATVETPVPVSAEDDLLGIMTDAELPVEAGSVVGIETPDPADTTPPAVAAEAVIVQTSLQDEQIVGETEMPSLPVDGEIRERPAQYVSAEVYSAVETREADEKSYTDPPFNQLGSMRFGIEQESLAESGDLGTPQNRSRLMAMAAAAGVVVVLAAAGWNLLGPANASSTENTEPASPQVSESIAEPVRESSVTQAPIQIAADEPVAPVDNNADVPSQKPERSESTRTSPPAAKQNKPAPPPSAPPKQKKKVTVDDLINDN